MSHGAAHEVPEVPTRMAAVNKTAAPARSRVFLMCPGCGRAVMGSPLRSMSGMSMSGDVLIRWARDIVNVSRNIHHPDEQSWSNMHRHRFPDGRAPSRGIDERFHETSP